MKLTYSDTDNTFRTGTIFASGSYGNEYTISGGTDSFNDATGTFTAAFASDNFAYYTGVAIDMCFIFPEVGDAVQCINDTDEDGEEQMKEMNEQAVTTRCIDDCNDDEK